MTPKKKKSEKEESKEESEKKEDKEASSNKKAERKTARLPEKLKDIKSNEGIIGYILRTKDSASIDLKDPKKIIDYALLSSKSFEAGEALSKTFELGETQNVLLTGKAAKILSLKVEDQRLSIFMEKDMDHERIYQALSP